MAQEREPAAERSSGKETDWADLIPANQRPHATYWAWEGAPEIAEWGVARALEEELKRDGRAFFSKPMPRGMGNDPPDCEAVAHDGGRVGIEVTELVDGSSVAAARKEQPHPERDWRPDLIGVLERSIRRKDEPHSLKDPPYSEYVLVICTDEPWLDPDTLAEVAHHVFPRTSLITRAYFLRSFDAFVGRCPYIRLNLGALAQEEDEPGSRA